MHWSLKSLRAPSVALAVVLISIAAAPAADASIVAGQSVAGVKLGATTAQVKKTLGPPETPLGTEFFYPSPLHLRISFKHGQVQQILSYSKRQRANGVAVGSYRAALQHSYPRAQCIEGPLAPTYLYCVVGAHVQGRPSYTGFLFEHPDGPVVEVETGFGSVVQALKHP